MNFLEKANYDWMELLNFHERPFRAKFIPSKVWRDLDRYKNDSVGLANYFKKWRTKIEWKTNNAPPENQKYLPVGGEYDPEQRQCIIQVYVNNFNKFKFRGNSWERFKFKLIQVEMHELIHFMQYDRRYDEWSNYVVPYKKLGHAKKDAERRYLSEFDEIQAYAHCVFLEYKMYRPKECVSDMLSRSRSCNDSKTLTYILKVFDYDYNNNKAIQKIIQQVGKWERKYSRLTA